MALIKRRKEFFSVIIFTVVITSLISVFVVLPYFEGHTNHIKLKVSNGYSSYNYTGNFYNSSLEPYFFHTSYSNVTIYEEGYGNSTLSMNATGELQYTPIGSGFPANVELWFTATLYGQLHLSIMPSSLSVYLGVTGITPDQTADMWNQNGINISFSNGANYYIVGFGHVNMSMGFLNENSGNYFNFSYIPTFDNTIQYHNSTDIYTLTMDLRIGAYDVLVSTEMWFTDVIQ